MLPKEKGLGQVEKYLKKESDRTRYWYDKFVGSITPWWKDYQLTQTQESRIKKLISTIVSHTINPGEVINPIITNDEINDPDFGMGLWKGLDYLMVVRRF